VFVWTLAGNLTLGTNVQGGSGGVTLVAADTFQNPDGYTISAPWWNIWANTWVGETRGGLAGSGALPNLFNCAYAGTCGVSIPAGYDHFIYAQQPTVTLVANNASRVQGTANPAFTYTLNGLILGDTGAGLLGALGSSATAASPTGTYAINGSFSSAAGYAVNVVPGTLTVTAPSAVNPATLVAGVPLPVEVSQAESMNTYTFDRNVGTAPICLAPVDLGSNQAPQGDDPLASEWSRVRSRPNLMSCVNTQTKNGCGDF
jgi:hypothetical protein